MALNFNLFGDTSFSNPVKQYAQTTPAPRPNILGAIGNGIKSVSNWLTPKSVPTPQATPKFQQGFSQVGQGYNPMSSLSNLASFKPIPANVSQVSQPGGQQYSSSIGPTKPTYTAGAQYSSPIGPTQSTAVASNSNGYYTNPILSTPNVPEDQVQNAQMNQNFTDTLHTDPTSTVGADALAPGNTMSSLLQGRQKLEDNFMNTLNPNNDLINEVAKIRTEKAKLTEQYYNENKALEKNPEGVFGQGVLNDQQRKLKEKQNEQLGFLALRESALTGSLQLAQDEQKNILDNIKTISGLTGEDLVGSLQQDEVTGEWSGFFKDPANGQVNQKIVGKTSPKMNIDYHWENGQLFGIDKSKPLGSPGSVVKAYGGDSDPASFAADVQAYAGEYAGNGKVPTNLPPGISPAMVIRAGASLPKGDGALVNVNTNVAPTNVPAQYAEAITTLANITRNTLPEILKVYPKLITGGALNPFTTEDRQAYETYRQSFLSDLLKAKSGQAVTEQEYVRYQNLLPKNLDQLTGTGMKKLNNLNEIMNNELQEKLKTKQLGLYGYSKVMYDGKEHALGDPVSAGNLQGFIGPGGKVFMEPDFNSAGNASASNTEANRPQRNNNPGNVKQGGVADKYASGVDDQGHLVFDTPQAGFQGLQEDIHAKISGASQHLPANPTLAQLGKVYAENPNWTAGVARLLGVSPSTPTQHISLEKLTQAIAHQEGYYA